MDQDVAPGGLAAVLCLVKPVTFFLPLFFLAYMVLKQRRDLRKHAVWISILVFFLGYGTILLPWSLYASLKSNRLVIICDEGDINWLHTNNEDVLKTGCWSKRWMAKPRGDPNYFYSRVRDNGDSHFRLYLRFMWRNRSQIPRLLMNKLRFTFRRTSVLVAVILMSLFYVTFIISSWFRDRVPPWREFFSREKLPVFPLIYYFSYALMVMLQSGYFRFVTIYMWAVLLPAVYYPVFVLRAVHSCRRHPPREAGAVSSVPKRGKRTAVKTVGVWVAVLCFALSGFLSVAARTKSWPWNAALNFRKPVHVIFCLADHFEPGWNGADADTERARMERWVQGYPTLAIKHVDADGRHPRHTFFYPPHYYSRENLLALGRLAYGGFGEVELHLHHGHDTPESLRHILEKSKEIFSHTGALITAEEHPRSVYGFIHGMWGLDNSLGQRYCGVNNELQVLRETGCYADFTMPGIPETRPREKNCIYYAIDDPEKPKSYDTGVAVRGGGPKTGDLMIIQGPLYRNRRHRWVAPSIDRKHRPTEDRINSWIGAQIHVAGRPDWVFVKVHTHGCVEENRDVLLGKPAGRMYSYLEEKYNDGKHYKLHYVTAREMYNIIKSAEAGKSGNPNLYRDYLIPPYANTKIRSDVFYRLISYGPMGFKLRVLDELMPELGSGRMEFKEFFLKRIAGRMNVLEYVQDTRNGRIDLIVRGRGRIEFQLDLPSAVTQISGVDVLETHRSGSQVYYLMGADLSGVGETRVEIRFDAVNHRAEAMRG